MGTHCEDRHLSYRNWGSFELVSKSKFLGTELEDSELESTLLDQLRTTTLLIVCRR